MATRRRTESSEPRRTRPATTPEARQNQLVALAYDLVERRLQEGTASAQETTHFLRMGSSRERLEQERLEAEIEISRAKQAMLESAQRTELMYEKALKAMRSYSGVEGLEEELYDD